MRTVLAVICAVALLGSNLVAAEVAGDQEETLVKMKTEVVSKFLDRSLLRNEDPVAKSDVRLEYKNFGLEFQGAMDLTDFNDDAGELTDVNLQVDYNFSWNKIDFQVGILHHAYPASDDVDGTTELFVKASKEILYNLTPYIASYLDIDEAEGIYTEIGVTHVYDLTDKVQLKFLKSTKLVSHASLGYGSSNYNEYYFGVDDNAVQDFKIGTGLELGFGTEENWTLTPSVEYYNMIDNKLADATSDEGDCGFIFGLALGCKF